MTRPECLLKGIVEWRRGERERFVYRAGRTEPYRIEPLPAPVHYGCLPAYFNPADQAEVDAVWLGNQDRQVDEWVEAQVTGLLHLNDQDHKVVFGPLDEAGVLLSWFGPQRGARLQSAEAALTWLSGLPRT
ncbi:inorganic pyrophosphatase [Deinococcus irradiatisoli]|uniref:Inorganic pyrophosphatase n=1 Tax=Deinococcus irradiatisoli TaxID=2202254 RepID=A0A2Z3JDT9_9DEIO|nr:inorganic pyrophosphatase [Deinococcus irradiatisoli]AWN23343.1 inorganic pyrophosphatase [Deinococcus irradiatisoli]